MYQRPRSELCIIIYWAGFCGIHIVGPYLLGAILWYPYRGAIFTGRDFVVSISWGRIYWARFCGIHIEGPYLLRAILWYPYRGAIFTGRDFVVFVSWGRIYWARFCMESITWGRIYWARFFGIRIVGPYLLGGILWYPYRGAVFTGRDFVWNL